MNNIKTVLTDEDIAGIHYIETECREHPSPLGFARAIEAAVLAASAPAKTQFHAKPLDGWVVTLQVNGDLLIESPSGDSAGLFRDDLSPLGEVTRQLVQSLIFGNYAAPVDAQDAVDVPNGSWLWVKLMDWCKKNRVSPDRYNDLFEIAGEAHSLNAALQASQTSQDQVKEK